MTFKLVFKLDAKKEWDNLDATIRTQFKKKLRERIEEPHIEASRLSGMKDCYKIKLRRAGYQGTEEEDVIDQWLQDICRNIVTETYEKEQASYTKEKEDMYYFVHILMKPATYSGIKFSTLY